MSVITELDLYAVCRGCYEAGYPFDLVFQGENDDETYVGIKRFGPLDVVAFRGSATPLDWARNFCAAMIYERGEGWVNAGMHIGLDGPLSNLPSVLGHDYIVVGHSRGAGMGTDFACDMVMSGRPPKAMMLLAPPRTGGAGQTRLLVNVPVRAYRNKGDPVTEVPPWCGHPYPLIDIDVPPAPGDPWGFVAPHHSELYGAWIAKLDPMPVYAVEELAGA